ncbi:MAG: hypothetical protein AAF623_07495 [Planctomycetota bacterium]
MFQHNPNYPKRRAAQCKRIARAFGQLANAEEPQLDKALELARKVVARNPSNASYRDTLGTVLMKTGDFRGASLEFEKAMRGVKDPVAVRKKLAQCFQNLGMEEMAEQHLLMIKKAEQESRNE